MTGHRLTPDTERIHGTCVAIAGKGILLLGPPGVGKSSMALSLIDQPGHGISGRTKNAQLVADDQVIVQRDGVKLVAHPPAPLAGLLEVRGLGIVTLPYISPVVLSLCVRFAATTDIERMPDFAVQRYTLLGVSLALVEIDAGAWAPARVRAALDHLDPA